MSAMKSGSRIAPGCMFLVSGISSGSPKYNILVDLYAFGYTKAPAIRAPAIIPHFGLTSILGFLPYIYPICSSALDSERSRHAKPILWNLDFTVFWTFWFFLGNLLQTCNEQDYILYIAYWLPIDCLLIALDAHMLSQNGYSVGTAPFLGPGPGPGPISMMAEQVGIKGNQ